MILQVRTPDVKPEFLEPCSTETVNAEYSDRSARKGDAHNQAICPCILTEGKGKAHDAKDTNKCCPARGSGEETTRLKHQKPHAKAEST